MKNKTPDKCRCGNATFRFILTENLVHYGKLVCLECKTFWRWLPVPGGQRQPRSVSNLIESVGGGDYLIKFGKHEGQLLSQACDTDLAYVEWLLKGNFPEEFKDILRFALEGGIDNEGHADQEPGQEG